MRTITIFCPDTHITYDRTTLDKKGVGGGVTTRLRMAYALAKHGNAVKLYINCPRDGEEKGVETYHWSRMKKDHSDVFIATTSGGKLDLSSLMNIDLGDSLKVLLVHGVMKPQGMDSTPFDYVYAPSNYIKQIVVSEWGVPQNKVFVSHRGVQEENFRHELFQPYRDPYTLVYAGHPSKGLNTAVSIFKILKERDRRFSLHVYGDNSLWGEEEGSFLEPSVFWHGTIGQMELARRLQTCSFSINIQTRQEPFGMAIIEAMRAGCIVLASPVGAYPEIIAHGKNGFLIPGDPARDETRQQAAELILALVGKQQYTKHIRNHAVHTPLSWDQVARAWEGHWDWHRSVKEVLVTQHLGTCNECQGDLLLLADGLHCTNCGNYQIRSDR